MALDSTTSSTTSSTPNSTGTVAVCGGPREDELIRQLADSVELVFETMVNRVAAIVERDPDESVNEDDATFAYEAVVDFRGNPEGSLVLRCTSDGAVDIARGMLMLSPGEEVPLAEVRDALGECANLVCGALKTRAFGRAGDTLLSVPRLAAYSAGPASERRGRLVFELERGALSVEIWLERAG